MKKPAEIIIYAQIDWRIRLNRDPNQWIIERKSSAKAKEVSWAGRSWCQTKDALLRCWSEYTGEAVPEYLHTLPDRARLMA